MLVLNINAKRWNHLWAALRVHHARFDGATQPLRCCKGDREIWWHGDIQLTKNTSFITWFSFSVPLSVSNSQVHPNRENHRPKHDQCSVRFCRESQRLLVFHCNDQQILRRTYFPIERGDKVRIYPSWVWRKNMEVVPCPAVEASASSVLWQAIQTNV